MSGRPRSYALFSALYPPHLGGVEAFTRGLARALVARGSDVVVVTNDTEGTGAGWSREDGVDVLRLPCRPFVSGRLPLPRAASLRRRLLAPLAERPLDGALVNTRFYPHSLLGMRLARSRGLAPVVLDHGSDWLSFSSAPLDVAARAYERALTAWGRRYGAEYYGISEKSAEWLETFGIRAVGVIPNAIDAAAFRAGASGRDFRAELGLASDAPVVAFLGRLIPEKGVHALLEASRDERLARAGATLVLAGDGPLADEVHAAEGPRLRWVGRLGRADAAALLAQADLLCLPTRSEGFATALLEAAACGCPALVTDVGGAREVTGGGSCGRIMDGASAAEVAGELAGLLAAREELVAMGERARARVESRFTWEATADAFERACERAARDDRGER